MSVFTIVQRALPFTLHWKRRLSTDKGKEKEIDIEVYPFDRDSREDIQPGTTDDACNAESAFPGTTFSLHCDVSHTLHIAVKSSPDHPTRSISEDSPSEVSGMDSDVDMDADSDGDVQLNSETGLPLRGRASSSPSSTRTRFARVVRWASIVSSRSRWNQEREKELLVAEKQLARCQKAWSSEQELWLAYIHNLSEEKAAHEGFMSMRTRQQEEERYQFRKAWKRRRSVEAAMTVKEDSLMARTRGSDASKFVKLRRLQRYGNWASTLMTAESTALTCQG